LAGPSLAQTPLLEENRLSTDGTFPWVVAKQGIDFSLQEALPHQAAHFAPTLRAFHVDISLMADDEILKRRNSPFRYFLKQMLSGN
jgi:hypothetical protein